MSLQQQVFVADDQPPLPVLPALDSAKATALAAEKVGGKKRKPAASNAPPKTTAVYVSGLPLDITKEELIAFMAKCGIIKKDTETGEYKVKLYEDEQGRPKGDALVVYFKRESVDLAMQILDESEFRAGSVVRVSEVLGLFKCFARSVTGLTGPILQAKFEHHQQQEKPTTTIVGKKNKKKKPKINQEEELSWVEWETRRHVIIKYMFTPEEAYVRYPAVLITNRSLQLTSFALNARCSQGDDDFYTDLKSEIREEVEKYGEVEVLTVFEVCVFSDRSDIP